jgi:site-specific recombinase XerD
MFEEIFLPKTAEKYRSAPFADERARSLRQLKETGAVRGTLLKHANGQLNLVRLLNLKPGDRVTLQQIEAAAMLWSQPMGRRWKKEASAKARQTFINCCINWLRSSGGLDEPEGKCLPQHAEVTIFEEWLRNERCLSETTVRDYCRTADQFLTSLAEKSVPLITVQMVDIDDAIAAEHRRGAFNRRGVHDYAQRLRSFLRFVEAKGLCRRGLAEGIMAPGFMADETVPKGLKRGDVLRLLASVQGKRPVDKRDRAILMLFAVYGLRAGEVAGLTLDDLDWENGLLRVRCSKPGRTHLWPLSQEVGHAILRYIRGGRPSCFGRSLFLTSFAPICPLGRKALGMIVRHRLMGIGIVGGRRGPHALRHGAAQHLMDQGTPMKVIGDFLGHREPSSTAVYAKVNLAALREVAALDLEGLV